MRRSLIRGVAGSDTEMVVHNSSRKTTAILAVAGVILLAGMNAGYAASGKHASHNKSRAQTQSVPAGIYDSAGTSGAPLRTQPDTW